MKKQNRKRTWIFILIPIILVLLLLLAAFLFLRQRGSPSIVVYSPGTTSPYAVNDRLLVHAVGSDNQGIRSMEIWKNGILLEQEDSSLDSGSLIFPILTYWRADSVGTHTFIVRATAQDGRQGTTRFDVEVVDAPPPVYSYEVEPGDSLDSIADAFGLDPDALRAENPGVDDSPAPGTSLSLPTPEPGPGDDDPEAEPLVPIYSPPPETISRLRPGISRLEPLLDLGALLSPMSPARIQPFQVYVDKAYDGVFCYASFNGAAFTRYPLEGFMLQVGETLWTLEGLGTPGLMVPDDSTELTIRTQCLGYQASEAGGVIFDLGTLEFAHPADQWDGSLVEQETIGSGGWFKLLYGIQTGIPPVPTPEPGRGGVEELLLVGDCLTEGYPVEQYCTLGWTFASGTTPDWVTGYRIYRGPAVYDELDSPTFSRYYLYNTAREIPFCGTIDYLFVSAVGADDSVPPLYSNVISLQDPVCREKSRLVEVTPLRLKPYCLEAENYEYWASLDTGGIFNPLDDDTGTYSWEGDCYDTSSPDDWPEVLDWCPASGYITANHIRLLTWCDFFPSGTVYNLSAFSQSLYLGPTENLVIQLRFDDVDISSGDDVLCDGNIDIDPATLDTIMGYDSRQQAFISDAFCAGDGCCLFEYRLTVIPPEEVGQPPAPIIVP